MCTFKFIIKEVIILLEDIVKLSLIMSEIL